MEQNNYNWLPATTENEVKSRVHLIKPSYDNGKLQEKVRVKLWPKRSAIN